MAHLARLSVVGIAGTCLLGWALHVPVLTTWGGPVPMVPLTGLCLLGVACVSWLRVQPWRADALTGGVTTGVVLSVVGRLMGLDNPLEVCCLWLVPTSEWNPTGQMALSTAVAILFALLAVWLPARPQWVCRCALWMLVALVWWQSDLIGPDRMARPTMLALLLTGFAVEAKKRDITGEANI